MIASMTNVKADLLKAVQRLPNDATLKDVVEHLHVLTIIYQGLSQIAAGETLSHEEVVKGMKQWRE